jgi:hypothetical protein
MSDVGLSLAQMRAASATNLLLLGFDTHMFDAKARPEEVLRAPIDHKRFETLLHFLLTVVFPNDVVRLYICLQFQLRVWFLICLVTTGAEGLLAHCIRQGSTVAISAFVVRAGRLHQEHRAAAAHANRATGDRHRRQVRT